MATATPRRLRALCGAAILIVAGCQSQAPRPVTVPELTLTHYAGTPLARADAPSTRPATGDALAVTLHAYLMPASSTPPLRPFASGVRMVTSSGEAPLLALPASLADARIGFGPEARRIGADAAAGVLGPYVDLGLRHAAVAPGTSAELRVSLPHAEGQAEGLHELELAVARPVAGDQPLRIALTRHSSGLPAGEAMGSQERKEAQSPQPRREMAVAALAYAPDQERDVAILVPVEFATGEKQALLLLVRVAPGSGDPEHQAAVEAAQRELAAEAVKAPSPSSEQLVLQSALRTAESAETRRAALVYLASQAEAPILLDVALVADGGVLGELVKQLPAAEQPATGNDSSLGWRLDRIAFDMMGKLLIDGKLSPELRAVLSRHAGEAGRNRAVMDQLVGQTVSRRDLENRLLAENYILLEDVSPAARVQAYDWLKAKGKAPAGYDPLGPADQRRKTLEAAIEQMAQSTPSGGASE